MKKLMHKAPKEKGAKNNSSTDS